MRSSGCDTTFRWKVDGLDATGLHVRIGASTLTLGGLLKHLAAGEDYMFTRKLHGEPIGEPWTSLGADGTDDWEFRTAASDPPELLYGCGIRRWSAPGSGWVLRCRRVAWTRPCSPPSPTASTPVCAGWCVT